MIFLIFEIFLILKFCLVFRRRIFLRPPLKRTLRTRLMEARSQTQVSSVKKRANFCFKIQAELGGSCHANWFICYTCLFSHLIEILINSKKLQKYSFIVYESKIYECHTFFNKLRRPKWKTRKKIWARKGKRRQIVLKISCLHHQRISGVYLTQIWILITISVQDYQILNIGTMLLSWQIRVIDDMGPVWDRLSYGSCLKIKSKQNL